jgi:hypothetical protein
MSAETHARCADAAVATGEREEGGHGQLSVFVIGGEFLEGWRGVNGESSGIDQNRASNGLEMVDEEALSATTAKNGRSEIGRAMPELAPRHDIVSWSDSRGGEGYSERWRRTTSPRTYLFHFQLVASVCSRHIIGERLVALKLVVAGRRGNDIAVAGDLAAEAGDGPSHCLS